MRHSTWTTEDRKHLHELHERYYGSKAQEVNIITNEHGHAHCIECGKKRKLGKRMPNKGRCKRCKV